MANEPIKPGVGKADGGFKSQPNLLRPPKCGRCNGDMLPKWRDARVVGWYCLKCA